MHTIDGYVGIIMVVYNQKNVHVVRVLANDAFSIIRIKQSGQIRIAEEIKL